MEDAGKRQQNEGEGNKTAAREYNQATTDFARSGKVEGQAQAAKRALDGAEGESLRQAESIGKQKSKGEDPKLKG